MLLLFVHLRLRYRYLVSLGIGFFPFLELLYVIILVHSSHHRESFSRDIKEAMRFFLVDMYLVNYSAVLIGWNQLCHSKLYFNLVEFCKFDTGHPSCNKKKEESSFLSIPNFKKIYKYSIIHKNWFSSQKQNFIEDEKHE